MKTIVSESKFVVGLLFFCICLIGIWAWEIFQDTRLALKHGADFEPHGGCGGPDDYCETTETAGFATWYGDDYRGRIMANGQLFNPDFYTAAMDGVPINSMAEVQCSRGRAVLVKITDRLGPKARERGVLIDLSLAAFEAIAPLRLGRIAVRVHLIPLAGQHGQVKTTSQAGERVFSTQ